MNLIRDYRKAAEMTQAELAMIVGCRRETIANLEKDRYKPSLVLADAIAGALHKSIYEVFPITYSAEYNDELIKEAMKKACYDLVDEMMRLETFPAEPL